MQADGTRTLKLAEETVFRLGELVVEPATRQVHHRGAAITLEPRVMQVLVVLARSPGRVVGRQELIERCWDGRVVGDNAINRVVSRLRHLADELGGAGFAIETIARVGYRLHAAAQSAAAVAGVAEAAAVPPAPAANAREAGVQIPSRAATAVAYLRRRRWLLGAGVGAALAGTGALGVVWRGAGTSQRTEPDEQSAALWQRGDQALRQGTHDSAGVAVEHFRVLCERQPDRASNWGRLALAYAARRGFDVESPLDPLAESARAAARRAQERDPADADAAVALAMLKPLFRGWRGIELACTALLQRHPQHWPLLATLARIHAETGRWNSALPLLERALRVEPLLPAVRSRHASALWCVGRDGEAARAFADCLRLWPRHSPVWHRALEFHMHSGRVDQAAALLDDDRLRPLGASPLPREIAQTALQVLGQAARAPLAERLAGDIAAARAAGVMGSVAALPLLAAIGRLDAAYEVAQVYYFGGSIGSRTQAPPAPNAMRPTALLFAPPTAAMRADPRFGKLTAGLGLDDYWRVARVEPDHRRAAVG